MGFLVPKRGITQSAGIAVSVAVVAALGAARLTAPLGMAQAGFLASATDPGHAHTDQPGLLLFYLAAARLLDGGEVAVHALELVILLTMSAVVALTLSRHLENRWLAACAPLATVGIYYEIAPPESLGGAGMLACVPVYFSLWLINADWSTPRKRAGGYFLSGVCTAAAALLHPVATAIPVLLIAISAIVARTRHWNSIRSILVQRLGPAVAGFSLPLVIFGFVSRAAFPPANFLEAWRSPGAPPADLAFRFPQLDLFLVLAAIPWLMLGAVAVVRMRRRIWARPFWLMTLAWFAGAIAIWPGSMWLAAAPFGLLGLAGLDEAIVLLGERGVNVRLATAILAPVAILAPLPAMAVWAREVRKVPEAALTLDATAGASYRVATDEAYRYAFRDTRFLTRPDSALGPVVVCGGPLHFLTLRRLAPSRATWIEPPPARASAPWSRLKDSLERTGASYLFLDQPTRARFLRDTTPERAWFTGRYELFAQSSAGAWYRPIASVQDMSRIF
ncbi:MAG: hypothetical protein R2729_14900 [Bryobacteraceae bacterium]